MVARTIEQQPKTAPAIPRPRSRSIRRAPLPLVIASLLVALLMIAPAIYLLIRASDAGMAAFDLLRRPRNVDIIRNSIILSGLVGISSALIGVPFAWLLERTDLPARRLFSIMSPLPLAIPSYVGALTFIEFLGPRGMLQRFLADHTTIDSIPSIYGFWGSFLALTLFTFPYVLHQVRATFTRLDPSFDDAARSLGAGLTGTLTRIHVPLMRSGILTALVLVFVETVKEMPATLLLRPFGVDTLSVAVWERTSESRWAEAALPAVAIVFVGLFPLMLTTHLTSGSPR